MPRQVIYVGGGKGGVGKSLVSMTVIDWLQTQQRPALLIEGDGANSDVYKAYKSSVAAETCDFDGYAGWLSLTDKFSEKDERTIVINSGARCIEGVRNHGYLLNQAAIQGLIDLRVLWPINRSKDSVIALTDFYSLIQPHKIGVLQNLFFGNSASFSRWSNFQSSGTNLAVQLQQTPIATAELPDLADRAIDRIYDDRETIAQVHDGANFVDRTTVAYWRQRAHAALAAVL